MLYYIISLVPVAQLDRVFGYEPKGRGFESLQARHKKRDNSCYLSFYIVSDDENPLYEVKYWFERPVSRG